MMSGFRPQLPSRWQHIMQQVLAVSFGSVLFFFLENCGSVCVMGVCFQAVRALT